MESELAVSVLCARSGHEALGLISKDDIGLVIADVKMPGMDGISLLRESGSAPGRPGFIMMTAFGTVESAVESLKLGAYDFITKPFDEDKFLHTVKNFLDHQNLVEKTRRLEDELRAREKAAVLIGDSPPMLKIRETIGMVAPTDVTVLITGETGTGKELAAHTIHELSSRSDGPFVVVNCPAIPESILESELFGYRRGAFTGASENRKGLIEAADGGTLFLDEIGDIIQPVQTKLLRVLEGKEIKPLGETETRTVDVRVIVATNQDLREKTAKGQFREDLFFRLNVVTITMPSLKDIREDIPAIASDYLRRCFLELDMPEKRLSPEAVKLLASRSWKGNVRELQNVLKKALLFSKEVEISPADFSAEELPCTEVESEKLSGLPYRDAKDMVLRSFNKRYIASLLMQTEGNVTLAAQKAGMERQSLQYLMKRHGISSQDFKSPAK